MLKTSWFLDRQKIFNFFHIEKPLFFDRLETPLGVSIMLYRYNKAFINIISVKKQGFF
jgi:hypothetical protein